jgi:hypothetical protein
MRSLYSASKVSRTSGLAALGLALATACSKQDEPRATRVAPPASLSAAPAAQGELKLRVAQDGLASFLIDAPLEKIKGRATKFRGELTLDPKQLGRLSGQVEVDLSTLLTETFEDAAKNNTQTEHARNWLELGVDVEAKEREENQWARFAIRSADVSPTALVAAPEKDGKRRVEATVSGEFWLHGVSVPKTVKLAASFEGPADAPRLVAIETLEPFSVSLGEHDVKPRDITGKFLQGALEKVGDKIVDRVQVSLKFQAAPEPSR